MNLENIKIVDKEGNKFNIKIGFKASVVGKGLKFTDIKLVILNDEGIEVDSYPEKECNKIFEKYDRLEEENNA